MIAVKRKISNVVTDKTLSTATSAAYTLSINDIRRVYASLAKSNENTQTPGLKQVTDEELRWYNRWLSELTSAAGENSIALTVTPNIIMEKNSDVEYLDSDEISIDLFNERFLSRTNLNKTDLKQATKIVALGVSNNFRFYNRPDCRIVVLDYRKLLDCLAFYYGYRELGISIAQIEGILEDCSAAVLNQSTELEGLIKYSLGAYKSPKNQLEGIVQRDAGVSCKDGDIFELISSLRISTNCFQIVHSSHQVETWQHHRIALTPKITYSAVLEVSRLELLTDLVRGLMNEICSNKELQNIKIICADYGCVALSVPKTTTEESLRRYCTSQIRLFNRQFIINPRLYSYNPMTDRFVEEEK